MMTREESHKKCLSRDCHCVNGKDRDRNYHVAIDAIFNDFESRTCENCYYHIVNCSETIIWCGLDEVDMRVTEDFGCNKFKRR